MAFTALNWPPSCKEQQLEGSEDPQSTQMLPPQEQEEAVTEQLTSVAVLGSQRPPLWPIKCSDVPFDVQQPLFQ